MNVIIVGCSNVGQTLAAQLNREGNDITIIDLSQEKINDITAKYDVMVSEDGIDFRLAGSYETSPVQKEREDQFALKDATNVSYVMIVMHVPGSNYNYQAREIDLFVSK